MEAKIGLHTGKAGLLLSKYVCKQINSNELQNEIKEIQHHISNANVELGVGGVAGFLWLLNYLEREDSEILGFSVSDFTADVDPYLGKHALFMIKQGIYDFFYGSLGIANYIANSNRTTQKTDFLQSIGYFGLS